MATPVLLKRCSRCGREKPLSEFYKDSASPDGHKVWCKFCAKEYNKLPYVVKRRNEKHRRRYREDPEYRAHAKRNAHIQDLKSRGTHLKKRTGKCEMPNCSDPARAVHHLIPRWLTHDDSPENLIELCYAHHNKAEAMLNHFFRNEFLTP